MVAKLDGAGNWLWATRAGGSAYCYPTSIAVDANGQPYIAGRFTLAATFGSYTIGAVGYYDAFVAKLGVAGTWQWVAQCGSSAADDAVGLALDNQGNAYIAGSFLGPTLDVGATTLKNSTTNKFDVFAAKLDGQSNWQWAIQATGSGDDIATSGALDGLGRFWIAGYSLGPALQFGSSSIAGNPVANRPIGFVARLNSQVLAAKAAVTNPGYFAVYPNPSRGTVWLRGLPTGQSVSLHDLTGRLLLTAAAPATGTLQLSLTAALAPGVYVVRSGEQAQRLTIE